LAETNTELHEARALVEYGEAALPYARAQFLTKGFEAVGLPSLSVCDRRIDAAGRVVDFDGRLMREKTEAALGVPVAPFDHTRRQIEHRVQLLMLDTMQPGQKLIERSKHPKVAPGLAARHGYSPVDEWLMVRLYHRTEDSLILHNYTIPHGLGPEGITHQSAEADTTIESLLLDYDQMAEAATGRPHFLGEVWTGGERDYGVIELRRREAEAAVERYLAHYARSLEYLGRAERSGWMSEVQAAAYKRRLERGFHTILLVELNPDRAREEIIPEDYAWMQFLLRFAPEEAFEAAYEVAERNRLIFIACGELSGPEQWYGAYKTIGTCVNCKEGPQWVGEKGWCQACISGHCGTH
jgi:hypothetical protein